MAAAHVLRMKTLIMSFLLVLSPIPIGFFRVASAALLSR
jgi:hypothetical protein